MATKSEKLKAENEAALNDILATRKRLLLTEDEAPAEEAAEGGEASTEEVPKKRRGGRPKSEEPYKSMCYSLPLSVIEDAKYIARYDRRPVSAVVSDALREYAAAWEERSHEEQRKAPRKLRIAKRTLVRRTDTKTTKK